MKKIVLLICFAFIFYNSSAQSGPREKIEAFKVAFITDQLNLSSKEAQQFWPIYNDYQKTVEKLNQQQRNLTRSLRNASDGPSGLNDKQAGEFINNYLDAEEKKFQSRRQLMQDLQQVIPNKKIIKLIKAESDFNKKLIERVKQWRNRRNN